MRLTVITPVTGSSPRVRGTAPRARVIGNLRRFIPACAGNRAIRESHLRPATVHPRVCGEQAIGVRRPFESGGSSPRVRGTARSAGPFRTPPRFIPACAGNSPSINVRVRFLTVHPRVCGEQPGLIARIRHQNGSSPRVRGTVHDNSMASELQRFIPACAGNRARRQCAQRIYSVHPRVCGEQLLSQILEPRPRGSSPRVRGTAVSAGTIVQSVRFIPACAGNSFSCSLCFMFFSVHPRVCGEQSNR